MKKFLIFSLASQSREVTRLAFKGISIYALVLAGLIVSAPAHAMPEKQSDSGNVAGVRIGDPIATVREQLTQVNPKLEFREFTDRNGNLIGLLAREFQRVGSKERPVDEIYVLANARGDVVRAARSREASKSVSPREFTFLEANG